MATSTAKKAKSATKPATAKVSRASVAVPGAAGDAAQDGAVAAPGKPTPPQLRKKELIARVVEALDGKKKGSVKDIVEATLATLGAAVQNGEALTLPPFGRGRVTKQTGEGAASMTTLRLRGAGTKIAGKAPKEALAEVGEDD